MNSQEEMAVNYVENGAYCPYCGEWVSICQSHQCTGSWGGWRPPIKTTETCPHCGKIIEKWIDLNQPLIKELEDE